MIFLLNACNVSNNVYLNDPNPVGEDGFVAYLGGGTGLQPDIDSLSETGDVYFNNNYTYAPVVFIAGQAGLTERVDLRFAVHLPYVVAGMGGRLGIQYAATTTESKFNMAIGSDFGFVFARDSFRIFGTTNPIGVESTGGMNLDFYLPMAYNFNPDIRLIITPRYSFNGVFIRLNKNESKSKFYTPMVFGLTAGLKIKRFHIEYTNLYYKNIMIPSLGVAYVFDVE